uniref:Uncharacterized protein n=1 Tax=viral metagenome TaxID=1070528 RepID=A0A6M3M260_9ZZZZ
MTLDDVLALKERHAETWRDQPESYWCARLMQEVGELASALVGDHEHSSDWELAQIASIALNWLELRGDIREVREAKAEDDPR